MNRSPLFPYGFFAFLCAAGLFPVLAQQEASKVSSDHGPRYRVLNATGKFSDAECFWSLDHGKQWHPLDKESVFTCPKGNGRLYFCLGKPPKNFDDRTAIWDFIEYASENSESWHGNTTQVDAFCVPITIEMGGRKLGITTGHDELLQKFKAEAPAPFKDCVKGQWIVSPCRASFGEGGANARYFDAYIDEVWTAYATEKKTPSGKWIGKVTGGALTFTPVAGGKPLTCPRKPTTQEAFLGSGILAQNPQFCAAINRHVLSDPADWHNAAAFYKVEPCNWYAKFLHENSIDKKAYGFCYDDVAEQAAFFSVKGPELIVTLRWNTDTPGK